MAQKVGKVEFYVRPHTLGAPDNLEQVIVDLSPEDSDITDVSHVCDVVQVDGCDDGAGVGPREGAVAFGLRLEPGQLTIGLVQFLSQLPTLGGFRLSAALEKPGHDP